jgi:hypothetical protein
MPTYELTLNATDVGERYLLDQMSSGLYGFLYIDSSGVDLTATSTQLMADLTEPTSTDYSRQAITFASASTAAGVTTMVANNIEFEFDTDNEPAVYGFGIVDAATNGDLVALTAFSDGPYNAAVGKKIVINSLTLTCGDADD